MTNEDGILNDVTNSEIKDGTFEISKDVRILGDWAFYQCTDLENIEIPEGIIAIGRRAFRFCSGLKKVSIPDSVKDKCISNGSFLFCPKLQVVEVSQTRELTPEFKSKFPANVKFVRTKKVEK